MEPEIVGLYACLSLAFAAACLMVWVMAQGRRTKRWE